ncbi:hypothetical protein HK405_008397, partial [Cladochytrium tenue]
MIEALAEKLSHPLKTCRITTPTPITVLTPKNLGESTMTVEDLLVSDIVSACNHAIKAFQNDLGARLREFEAHQHLASHALAIFKTYVAQGSEDLICNAECIFEANSMAGTSEDDGYSDLAALLKDYKNAVQLTAQYGLKLKDKPKDLAKLVMNKCPPKKKGSSAGSASTTTE